jgi:hypothetical protein
MLNSLRAPLIVAEVIALGVILAIVEDTLPRVVLGLVIALLLARSALVNEMPDLGERPPTGLDERRHDHLYRHWVNVLLKKVREFHMVCQGVATGGVNMAVGQLRIQEIEREIQDLMSQVTESAKPTELKRRGRRPPPPRPTPPKGTPT